MSKLSVNERFEIKAHVFNLMTGFLAPGKDAPPGVGYSREERQAAWEVFDISYGDNLRRTLDAVDYVMRD